MGVYSNLASKTIALEATSTSAAQFAIDANRSQFELFEAMLECDFAMAFNESGTIALSEADVESTNQTRLQKIKEKIRKIIQKFKTYIVNVSQKFISFIKNLVANDKKLWDQYGNKITKESIKDFKGEYLQLDKTVYDEILAKTPTSILMDKLTKIDNMTSDEDIENTVSFCKKEADEFLKKISISNISPFKKIEFKVDDVEEIKDYVKNGYKKQIESINKEKDDIEKGVKEIQKFADNMKSSGNELDIKKANAMNACISTILSANTKYFTQLISIEKTRISANRSLFIRLGKFVTSDKEEIEKVEDEVVEAMNLLGMLSDDYVDSIYEECMGF